MHDEGQDAVRAARRLVQVVSGHSLVAQALLEVLLSLFLAIAVEVVDVLDRDFLAVRVDLDFQAFAQAESLASVPLALGYQQVIDLLVVDLHVLHLDRDLLAALQLSSASLHLREELSNGTRYDTPVSRMPIDQPVHRESFPTASLAVGEDRGMEPGQDLPDKEVNACFPEDALLRLRGVEDGVEQKRLLLVLPVPYPIVSQTSEVS